MKLLLDENLSVRLVFALAAVYPGMMHVHEAGLGAASDDDVWAFAKKYGYTVVSKDSDFAERSILDQVPAKVIWIRLGNCSTEQVERLLRTSVEIVRTFIEQDPETCLLLGKH